jgi:protein subunit release factor A
VRAFAIIFLPVALFLLECGASTSSNARQSKSLSWNVERQTWKRKMRNLLVEIRAAEGGDDAKLLVIEQFAIYERAVSRGRL